MNKKKLNLLPSEQKSYLMQEKTKLGAIIFIMLLGIGVGSLELYINKLHEKEAELQNLKNDDQQVEALISSLEKRIEDQGNLLLTLENKDFPMHSFLSTLSNEIPENLWLYSVGSLDYKSVETDDEETNISNETTEDVNQQVDQDNQEQENLENNTNTSENSGENQNTQNENIQNQPTANEQNQAESSAQGEQTVVEEGKETEDEAEVNPKAHKTLVIRGAGTSPTEIGNFVQILSSKNYVEKATLSSVEEYLANGQVYQAFEITVEGK